MIKPDLEDTWLSLENDLITQGRKGHIRRLIDIRDDKIHLLASNENGPRQIGISFGPIANPESIKGSLPACQNLSIWLATGSNPELFVLLTNNAYRSVFSGLCGFILDQCRSRPQGKGIGDTVISQLNEWKYFLENRDPEGLSPELQQGLFGELTFLTDILLPRTEAKDAVLSWGGSDRKSRDFSLLDGAVEIKTTTVKKHYKIDISNERQLDPADLKFLYLVHYNIQDDGKNRISLKDKVEQVRRVLDDRPEALHILETKLRNYGYLDIHDALYQTGYRIAERGFYIVDNFFPKLVSADIPPGVGDVKYSVVVSSCDRCLRDGAVAIREMGLEDGR